MNVNDRILKIDASDSTRRLSKGSVFVVEISGYDWESLVRAAKRKPQPPPPQSECANRCQTLPDGDYHHAPDCPRNPRGGEAI